MRPRLRAMPGLLALLLATPLSAALARAAGEGPEPSPTPPPATASAPAAATGDTKPATAPIQAIEPAVPGVAAAPAGTAIVESFPAPAPELQKDAAAAAAVADAPAAATAVAAAPVAQAVRRGDDVFMRIRRGLGSNVCASGDSSERWRRRYASNPAAFANRLEQILPLLDFVSLEVERVGLPSEFTFIPLVESWYKPEAIGVGGPAGMWQMIGSTARNHGIHIQPGYDGRLSPVESTRAALSYLKVLHAMFGGWEATVMAYNAGEGRMMQAFKRARSRDTSGDRRRPHGLSNITYDYVAKLQALSCLVDQPDRNNLRLPRASRFVPLAPVLMGPGFSSLEQFASGHGRRPEDLRRLNPAYREGRVVAGVPRLVLMPLGTPQAMPAALKPVLASRPEGTVPTSLDAGTIALAIQAADPASSAGAPTTLDPTLATAEPAVPGDALVGDALVGAAVVGDAEVAPLAPDAAMVEVADVAPTTTHRVLAGESLWTIARLHRLSIDQLRQLNRLDRRAVVHPGQTLQLVP